MFHQRSNAVQLGIAETFFAEHDIHIHVPAGAIPKDGPSAGVTMATALVSLLTARPVRPLTAMTGEITLRGKVLPIGGLKEKLLAAHRVGIRIVIVPKDNEKDASEIPPEILSTLVIHFVETVDEVLALALERPLQASALPSVPEVATKFEADAEQDQELTN